MIHSDTDPVITAEDIDWALPLHGAPNPSTESQGTSPGSFAHRPDIGGPLSFSSPDTPGMPPPSTSTAWDFLPDGWSIIVVDSIDEGCCGHGRTEGTFIRCSVPEGFEPITQLEQARLESSLRK